MYIMNTKQLRNFQKVYHIWKSIENEEDLQKYGLTITDYHIITLCLREISNNGFAVTPATAPAKWFAKYGFKIEEHQTINYKISLA